MLLGITEHLQEQNKFTVTRRMRIVKFAFLIALLLPFMVYALFHFNLISGKAPFTKDIQEPVAKVITPTGIGSAFLISPTLLLTARHVVEQQNVGEQVDLIFEQVKNPITTRGTIKYIAPTNIQPTENGVPLEYFLTDVAVLEIPEITEIEPFYLGESDAVENLDEVILIGYPNGDYSITKGNINSGSYQGLNLFKLDANANPGNSGGPCILKDDQTVIGILVGSSTIAQQGENVALKINDIKKILQQANIPY